MPDKNKIKAQKKAKQLGYMIEVLTQTPVSNYYGTSRKFTNFAIYKPGELIALCTTSDDALTTLAALEKGSEIPEHCLPSYKFNVDFLFSGQLAAAIALEALEATNPITPQKSQSANIDLKKTTSQELKDQVLSLLNLQTASQAAKWAKQQGMEVDLCYKAHWALVLEKAQNLVASA